MKASDTVLKPNELFRTNYPRETDTDIEASLFKQAQISFKAGYAQCLKDHNLDITFKRINDSKEAIGDSKNTCHQ